MAKCGYNEEVKNGAKSAITLFVIGAFASTMKRLKRTKYHRPATTSQRKKKAAS